MITVPGYEAERVLGKGSMATVYRARSERTGEVVALKWLRRGADVTPRHVSRFLREAGLVQSLEHEHIVPVLDSGATYTGFFIVMEYVGGGDLTRYTDSPQSIQMALDTVIAIAGALGVAHEQGLVHRDVKPANILLRDPRTPLLADFGVAKHLDSETLTASDSMIGSVHYMSPEQIEGREIDGRADFYSLGVVFYELLSGQRPFCGKTAIQVLMKHMQMPVPELPESCRSAQPLLQRMMAKKPLDRFDNASELVEAATTLRNSLTKVRPSR